MVIESEEPVREERGRGGMLHQPFIHYLKENVFVCEHSNEDHETA
jgi:hypothetical protein